jgi:hypothetical protein
MNLGLEEAAMEMAEEVLREFPDDLAPKKWTHG